MDYEILICENQSMAYHAIQESHAITFYAFIASLCGELWDFDFAKDLAELKCCTSTIAHIH